MDNRSNVFFSWWHIGTLLSGLLISMYFYMHLPDAIPTHFNASGVPDNWAERSFFAWFLLNAIGLLLPVIFYAVSRLIRKKPAMLNLPQRDALIALPVDRRGPVYEAIDSLLAQISCIIQALFMVIQWGSFQVATGVTATLPPAVLIAIFGTSTVILIVVVLQINKIDAAVKRANSNGNVNVKPE